MRNVTNKTALRGWKSISLMILAAFTVPVMAAPAHATLDRRAPALTIASECEAFDSDGWTVTQCPENPAEQVISKTFSLSALQTQNGVEKDCIDREGITYRLMNKDLSPNRAVPRGVEVTETGGVGVTGLIKFDTDGFAKGVRSLSMSNWTTAERDVRVVLHCTSDQIRWYH